MDDDKSKGEAAETVPKFPIATVVVVDVSIIGVVPPQARQCVALRELSEAVDRLATA